MTGDPRIDGYDWAGGHEAMLRFGPDTGPVVVAALPLFEEANRTRTFMAATLRALAARGIGSAMPDLPGQGESLVLLETVSLSDMRAAFAAAVAQAGREGRSCYTASIRSGAIVGGGVDAPYRRWQFAPQDGPALMRELSRVGGPDRAPGKLAESTSPVLVAGNLLSPALLSELAGSSIGEADRIVRLSTDPAPADLKIDGPPLWRRSEPSTDEALSQRLADDIAAWIKACEA